MIVLVGGQKGGTGKSTAAVTLAAMRARRGHDVALIDTDRQNTAADWAVARTGQDVPRVPCHAKAIEPKKDGRRAFVLDVQDLASRYGDVVIDAGGRDSEELRVCLMLADRVYVPIKPSYADAWTLESLQGLTEEAWREGRPDLSPFVVISQAYTDPRIPETQEAISLVSEYDALRWSGVILCDRIAYRRALGVGLCVEEMPQPDPKAVAETQALYRHAFDEEAPAGR